MQNLAENLSDLFYKFACFYTESQSNSLILISKCLTRPTEPTECVTNIPHVKGLHANGETGLTSLCYVNKARAMVF